MVHGLELFKPTIIIKAEPYITTFSGPFGKVQGVGFVAISMLLAVFDLTSGLSA